MRLIVLLIGALMAGAVVAEDQESIQTAGRPTMAAFAGGCFWCMEPPFDVLPGVQATISGFMGGAEISPTYRAVATGRTGHAETVLVLYDPGKVSYEQLLEVYWRQIDPTDSGGQFVDRGRQYRPVIFYYDGKQRQAAKRMKKRMRKSGRFEKSIEVEITPVTPFWRAEEYHQNYYLRNPVRYQYYRYNSGRDQYLDRIWADERG